MAIVSSMIQSSAISAVGLRNCTLLQPNRTCFSRGPQLNCFSYILKRRVSVRCSTNDSETGPITPTGVREAIDRATRRSMTREAILHNQATNKSEKRSVFGSEPPKNAVYPRPEIERRPETGDRSFGSVFAFDGAAPETINGRLAMVGFVWAFLAEKATGLTVGQQVFGPGAPGLVFFVCAVQLLTYASLAHIVKGESTDARSFGPFTARAERWNGRLAMIGFVALLIDELIHQSPVF